MTLESLYEQYPHLVKIVKKLYDDGWQFEIDNWDNGHNFNNEWIFQFKSPRMKEFAGEFSPEKTSLAKFRNRESQIVAREYRKNHDDSIHDQIQKVLTQQFLKNPTKTKLPKTKIHITL